MALRYLVPGGNGNYNSTSNWSSTDGGVSGASFPVSTDDIIINANSLNAPLTINVVSACKSFSASNYTGTITMSSNLSINGTKNTGNITLSSGMIITGSGSFIKIPTGTTGTITSNGAIFDCNFTFQAASATTTTITGAMQVNKNLTFSLNSIAINTVNSGTISVGGDIIHNSPVAGTSIIQMIGSTTATIIQVTTRYLQTNLVINKTGVWNQVDLYWGTSSRTLTYTAGIINHTGTFFVSSNSTLNTNGMTWNIIEPQGSINFTSICNANKIGRTSASAAMSFGGTHGFNVNILEVLFTSATIVSNVVFANAIQYNINSSLICTSNRNIGTTPGIGFRCNSGQAIINLSPSATIKLYRANILNIKSIGKTLRTVRATVTTSENCFVLTSNINQYSTTI